MTQQVMIATALGLLVYMTAAWLVARHRHRIDTVDTAYGSGFLVVALIVLAQHVSWRSALIALLVGAWSIRLSLHLYKRSANRAEDPRYVEISRKWKGNLWARAYVSIFLVQGGVIWLVSLPIMFAAGITTGAAPWWTVAGSLVWLVGFVVELLADRQLAAFIANPANKGKVMSLGVWRYSRHPNYFGEIVQWFGIGVIAIAAQLGFIGLIGPLTLAIVIIFISGIPPIEKRHQQDAKWQPYLKRTSVLIPWKPKN